jgi:rod shape-determining protein MreC
VYEHTRRARVLFVVLVLAAATFVTLDFRQRPDGPVERLQRVALAAFGPVQRVASAVLRPVGDAASALPAVGGGGARRENERLRAEVQRLRAAERGYQDLLGENERLRGTLAMAGRCGCRTVGAQVVARSASTFQRSVTVDAGTGQGIRPDMAVLDGDGLVGRVLEASGGYASIRLLSDPTSGVAVTLAGSKAPGLLRGRGGRDLQLQLLHANITVKVGEPVVTRAYDGAVFPAAIPVGVVTAVGPAADGLVRTATVRPFADTDDLDLVGIVVAAPHRPAPHPPAARVEPRPRDAPRGAP